MKLSHLNTMKIIDLNTRSPYDNDAAIALAAAQAKLRINRNATPPITPYVPDIEINVVGVMQNNPGPAAQTLSMTMAGGATLMMSAYLRNATFAANDFSTILFALMAIEELPGSVLINTPAQTFSRGLADGTAATWAATGWKTKSGIPVINQCCWEDLLERWEPRLAAGIRITSYETSQLEACRRQATAVLKTKGALVNRQKRTPRRSHRRGSKPAA